LLQLVLLWLGQSITYSTNLLGFCTAVGAVVTVALVIGVAGSLLELAVMENETVSVPTGETDGFKSWGLHLKRDMEETAPIPEEIEVTNDYIKRAE